MSSERESLGLALLRKWDSSSAPIRVQLSEMDEITLNITSGLLHWLDSKTFVVEGDGERREFDISDARFKDVCSLELLKKINSVGEYPESVTMDFSSGEKLFISGPLEILGN